MEATIDEFKIGDKIILKEGLLKIINIENGIYFIEINGKTLSFNKENLFSFIVNGKEKVFTHNCQQRLVCGQLGSIASRMALGDNQATTVDGEHKGAGMVSSQGVNVNIQYYFEQHSWIEKWFTDRGLTKKGWEQGEDPSLDVDPSTIDLGEDEDIFIEKKKTEIDFQGIHKEIDHTKDQKFEEV